MSNIIRQIIFIITCIGVILLLVIAGYFFVLYRQEDGHNDFAGVGAIIAFFLGGVGLTALGVMALTLIIGLQQGNETSSLIWRIGSRGLFILVTSWVTWIAAFLGLSGLADVSYEFAKLCDGPIAFLVILALQILLYWKLSQWLTRALSNTSKRGDARNDADKDELPG